MILIISNKWDIAIDFVVRELRSRNKDFIRLNTENLASEGFSLFLPDFEILYTKHNSPLSLSDQVGVVWNRRPGKLFDFIPREERPSLAIQEYVNSQWFTLLESLQLIKGISWVNHPQANDAMENKPRQLIAASKLGFNIPRTVITNDPLEVKKFASSFDGPIIAKALYAPLIEEEDQDYFIFTNEMEIKDIESFEEIKDKPYYFSGTSLSKNRLSSYCYWRRCFYGKGRLLK